VKFRTLLFAACFCLVIPAAAFAQAKDKAAKGDAQAMDPKAAQEMMAKAAAIGPQHEGLKKRVGEWNLTVKSWMDPSQPPSENKSTSVVTALMDGRYIQEVSTGDMMGMPFQGIGITGYDNVLKKYVSTWMDNFGTGIMRSEGAADASGNVVNWTGESADPMTGKKMKYRMVDRTIDDNKHVFEMFGPGPNGKEGKMMEITYERKM
jgi:hypothetical protein